MRVKRRLGQTASNAMTILQRNLNRAYRLAHTRKCNRPIVMRYAASISFYPLFNGAALRLRASFVRADRTEAHAAMAPALACVRCAPATFLYHLTPRTAHSSASAPRLSSRSTLPCDDSYNGAPEKVLEKVREKVHARFRAGYGGNEPRCWPQGRYLPAWSHRQPHLRVNGRWAGRGGGN